MAMFAGGRLEVFQDLVADLQPFQLDDANEFIAVLPDLALPEFERHGNGVEKFKRMKVCLSWFFTSGETAGGYFFFSLAAGFFFEALLTLAFFAIILIL